MSSLIKVCFRVPVLFIFVVIFLPSVKGQSNIDFPNTLLENEHLKVSVYLPDPNSGYYRSARFDWSGIISSLKYKNHEYFGEWFGKHDPFVHDAITGPVEEFSPVGYEEAQMGEVFMKIGVGMLEKSDEKEYRFSTNYKIIDHGIWEVTNHKDSVVFKQTLTSVNGYGYIYKKALTLKPDRPEMTITHSIKNTGINRLTTTVYNHNLFTIDNTTTGKNFTLTVPFRLKLISKNNDADSLLVLKGNRMHYQRDFKKGEKAKIDLGGFSANPRNYSISIENSLTKAGVRIKGNRPLYKLAFWSLSNVLSPEPYTLINIAPGKEFSWDIDYLFYEKKP